MAQRSESLAQSHTSGKQEGWDSNPDSQVLTQAVSHSIRKKNGAWVSCFEMSLMSEFPGLTPILSLFILNPSACPT